MRPLLIAIILLFTLSVALAQEPTPTETPTIVPSVTPTETPTPLSTDTATNTSTPSSIPTDTPTNTDTPSPIPTDTPSPIPTSTVTSTNTDTPTEMPPTPGFPTPVGTFPQNNQIFTSSSQTYVDPNGQFAIIAPQDVALLVGYVLPPMRNECSSTPYEIYLLSGTYILTETAEVYCHTSIFGRGAENMADATILQRMDRFQNPAMDAMFTVNNGALLTLRNVRMVDGYANVRAGGVMVWPASQLHVQDSVFQNNRSESAGGAVHNQLGTVILERTVFLSNSAQDRGGAIYGYGSGFSNLGTITGNCLIFQSNVANGEDGTGSTGGAIAVYFNNVTISGSQFVNNSVPFTSGIANHVFRLNGPNVNAQGNYRAQPTVVSTITNGVDARYQITVQPTPCPMNTPIPIRTPATPTSTPTLTPTNTPTQTPCAGRNVASPACGFHEQAARWGLPLPFNTLPVIDEELLRTQGYGVNRFTYQNSRFYNFTHGYHTGLDFIKGPGEAFDVLALCDGVIVRGRNEAGGSVSTTAGRGVSLRCFMDDLSLKDVDNDGFTNLSNIVVTYNHLGNEYIPEFGTIVSKSQIIGRTAPYYTCPENALAGSCNLSNFSVTCSANEGVSSSCIPSNIHLHLETFIARGYRDGNDAIRINPLLIFDSNQVNIITNPTRMGNYYPYRDSGNVALFEALPFDLDDNDDRDFGINAGELNEWLPFGEIVQSEANYNLFFTRASPPENPASGVQLLGLPLPEWTSSSRETEFELEQHLLLDASYSLNGDATVYGSSMPPYCNNFATTIPLPTGTLCSSDGTIINNDGIADIPSN